MTSWTGVVVALPSGGDGEMASRVPTHLHPVAGRPLVWHAVASLLAADPAPASVMVLGGGEIPAQLFQDLPEAVRILPDAAAEAELLAGGLDAERLMVTGPTTLASPDAIQALLQAEPGAWLPDGHGAVAAVRVRADESLAQALSGAAPLEALATGAPVAGEPAISVRSRLQLSAATRTVRDRLVRQLMAGGVTFLLPESVIVDVDVRIGRDTIIYPGAVLEGQTTIGDETVVGPGCRVIASWIGSGVELRGWNYIANTSIRNRAILEPYVRRGFD